MIDGKKVKFEFVLRYNSENPMRAKVAQMVKETFIKAGVVVNVQAIEFNTLLTQMDNRDFDALILSWGKGSLNADTTQIWATKSYLNKGSNAVAYSNPDADKLMEESEQELDPKKRFKIVQKLGALIYDDQPYAFLVEIPGFMAGFHSRIQAKKWVMKYDDSPPIWQYYSE
jgi:peptide/nickel transport system substrate-binding protein